MQSRSAGVCLLGVMTKLHCILCLVPNSSTSLINHAPETKRLEMAGLRLSFNRVLSHCGRVLCFFFLSCISMS